MSRTRTFQSNFSSGVLDPRLSARLDIKHFYNGVNIGDNMMTLPQGGFRKRPGTTHVDATTAEARFASFAFNVVQTYLLVFTDLEVKVYKDDVLQATVVTPWTTADLPGLYWTQSADTMILVHESHAPRTLTRTSHTVWVLATPALTIPTHDFGAGAVPVWSATHGWPKTVTFHSARLCFGGSLDLPQTFWASQTSDFFNFGLGTGLADEGIFVTLDTDQVNAINGIFSSRHLQLFTTGGEFYTPTNPMTPASISFQRQTLFGSNGVKPVSIDGSTLFVDRTNKSIREFLFTDTEAAYSSPPVSLLSPHLIVTPVDMTTLRGEDVDDSNYAILINTDGTAAVYGTMRDQQVSGWSRWTTAGSFKKAVLVVDTLYLMVEREINSVTVYHIEKLNFDVLTDDAVLVINGSPSASVTGLDHLDGEECRVKADGAMQPNDTPASGAITLVRTATTVEVGLFYAPIITTMPLNVEFQDGHIFSRKKRLVRCILELYQSLGVIVEGKLQSDLEFGSGVFDQTPTPFTGRKEVFLNGWDYRAQVTITQDDPLPLTILALFLEVSA